MNSYDIDGITVLPPLLAEYTLDPVLDIKHDLVAFEQGYAYEYHNTFKNSRDYSFNKHSNFYLTDSVYYDDVVNIQPLPDEYPVSMSSFLAFNRIYTDPLSALTANSTCLSSASAISALSAEDVITDYLTILPTMGDTGDPTTSRSLSAELFTDVKTQRTLEQKYYFNITFIDGKDCIIYHQSGKDLWYLSHKPDPGSVLQFVKVEHDYGMEKLIDQVVVDGGDKIVFQYTYYKSNNLLRIYKQYNGSTHIIRLLTDEERADNPENIPIRLSPLLDPDLDEDSETQSPNALELTDNTTIRVRPVIEPPGYNVLNSKIYNYSKGIDQNNVNVDVSKSTDALQSNMLVHSEYYFLTGESIPVNILPLKNYQDASGLTSPTNPWSEQNKYRHRSYNKIFTGTNQQQGTDKIYFDYLSSTTPLEFKPGMNYFNFPQSPEPVTRWNVNDTTLIESGAIAGDQPSRSDKIFKKRGNYKQTTRWGSSSDEHTGTWLCTWLSGGDNPESPPVWMDRYYTPGVSSGSMALATRTDTLHSKYENDKTDIFISENNDVYDEPSNMTFEPGGFYAYYRMSENDIQNNLSLIDSHKIQSGFDSYTTINKQPVQSIAGVFNFTGQEYAIAKKVKTAPSTGDFSITFDINMLNYTKPIGHQIIGNYTNSGVGVFNTNDVSPFVFIPGADGSAVDGRKQNSSIRIYDTNYNLYNYLTNDSFHKTGDTLGLFDHIIVRELPDNIFLMMSNGHIVECTHDGVIVAVYDDWNNTLPEGSEIADIAYDDTLIYILSHTGSGKEDFKIHTFNMVSKQLVEFTSINCTVSIPIPDVLLNNDSASCGQQYDENTPPNLIHVKDDHAPYNDHRTVYLAHGEVIKSGNEQIWVSISGAANTITGLQEKHDMLYGFNTRTLQPIAGKITDNKLQDGDLMLNITDFCIEQSGDIWLAHGSNLVTRMNSERKTLRTQIIEDQMILSMVLSRDIEDGEIQDRLIVLGKTSDGMELTTQIGPVPHPTNDRDNAAWRKASPWIVDGVRYTRGDIDITDPDDPQIIDSIVYPLTVGGSRFGYHSYELDSIEATDPTGRVQDGDYTLITDSFDILVQETQDVMFGNIFDTSTGALIEAKSLPDFSIDDISDKPQIQTQYEYAKENYNHYTEHNLNLKILLEPLFAKHAPELVNLKLDLKDLNNANPSTGFHRFTINVSNSTGRVELWIDGTLDLERTYNFSPEKFTFNKLLSKNIVCGCSPYLNDTILAKKINRDKSYIINDTVIKDFSCYNTTLTYHDQLNLIRYGTSPDIMHWNVPSGLCNYIEGVDRVFNHSIPPAKSNTYDLNIRNSGIRSEELQQYINNKITTMLRKIAPAGTDVRNMDWSNELLET